jgi:hypothetical protein
MDTIQFWQLIDSTRLASGGDVNKQEELLIEALAAMPEAEIFAYQRIFDKLDKRARRYDLFEVMNLIYGGISDSCREDARAWLIAQGQSVYENAIADPESLVDIISIEARHSIKAEPIVYAGHMALQKLTGFDDDYVSYNDPHDEPIEMGENIWRGNGISSKERDRRLKEKFPRIWAKFNWGHPD